MNENASTTVRKFRRSRNDRMVAGVCGGAAELLGIDATVLRVILAASTLFAGVGPLLYLICWLVVPEE